MNGVKMRRFFMGTLFLGADRRKVYRVTFASMGGALRSFWWLRIKWMIFLLPSIRFQGMNMIRCSRLNSKRVPVFLLRMFSLPVSIKYATEGHDILGGSSANACEYFSYCDQELIDSLPIRSLTINSIGIENPQTLPHWTIGVFHIEWKSSPNTRACSWCP